MSMPADRLTRRILLLLLVGAALAGCVSIPATSAVSRGRVAGIPDQSRLISNIPPGPGPGASKGEIVRGYFDAMLAYPQTSAIARRFLTPAANERWDPADGLVVYDNQSVVTSRVGATFMAQELGSLNGRGSWTSADSRRHSLREALALVRVRGQWRITNPPAGTLVDSDYFTRYYSAFSLYFFDPTRSVLAPDPVYLLVGDSTATTLVRDLLLGPTGDLAGVADTIAPLGTTLAVGVSTSHTGVAQVPLSADVAGLSTQDRQLFAAQVAWTLRQIPEIHRIAISVDGTRLNVPSVGQTFGADEFEGYDPAGLAASRQLFALSPAGLVAVSSRSSSRVLGPIGGASKGARSFAVDPSATLAAVVPNGGTEVLVGGLSTGSSQAVSTWFEGGDNLLRPSWDVHQVLWVVDRTPRGAVLYAVRQHGVHVVSAPGLTGSHVLSFAVSRDGVRIAAVVRDPAGTHVVIGVINRDPQHVASVSVLQVRRVVNPTFAPGHLRSLAWDSPTSVVVLGDEQGGDLQPFEVSIDGSTLSAPGGYLPVSPVILTAGPNSDAAIAIASPDGRLYIHTPDLQWVKTGGSSPLTAPAYPG